MLKKVRGKHLVRAESTLFRGRTIFSPMLLQRPRCICRGSLCCVLCRCCCGSGGGSGMNSTPGGLSHREIFKRRFAKNTLPVAGSRSCSQTPPLAAGLWSIIAQLKIFNLCACVMPCFPGFSP